MPARISGARSLFAAIALAAAMLLAGGCASYQLGSPSNPTFDTVFVPPVANDSFMPQSRAAVTTAVREAFARDGRVELAANAGSAGRVIEIRLTDYSREMATALPSDTALARKFVLTLNAEVRVVDPANREAQITPVAISVSVDAYTDSGQQQAEFQAVPQLADKLATEVVHRVLDVW